VQVTGTNCFVVSPDVVLALIVCKILLTQVPAHVINILRNFVTNPKPSHFHRLQMLAFHRVICNAYGRCVITMDRSFCLRVAKIGQRLPENYTILAIVEQCA
jgi:hypothetical protein